MQCNIVFENYLELQTCWPVIDEDTHTKEVIDGVVSEKIVGGC
jgi:hypothetical protein